jgi:sugar/nucleoside kinase (ribokinase family)
MIRVERFPDPRPGTLFPTSWHETIGSSGAGKAMNLARLGVDVVVHCLVGDDDAGRRVVAGLEAAGVEVDVVPDPTGTGRHVNLMAATGGRQSYLLRTGDATARFDPARIEALVASADVVLVEIIDQARAVIPIARRLGRPTWTDLHDTDGERAYERDFLEADVVVLSDDRLADPRPFMERLIAAGRRLVVCTRGARGAVALTGDGRWLEIPAEPVEAIVDTNGAGDAFVAGMVYGELLGLPVVPSLRVGARAAAMAVRSLELASPELTPSAVVDLIGASG